MKTTIDAFFDGRFMLEQPARGEGPRAGLDALLLAAMAPCEIRRRGARKLKTALDAGCGAGAVAIALACRCPDLKVTGVEREAGMAALMAANIRRNHLEQRVSLIRADLTSPLSQLRPLGLAENSFAMVCANPPFYEKGASRPCASNSKNAAHRLDEGDLEGWLRFLGAVCAPGGQLNMIHHPGIMPRLLPLLAGRFGDLRIRPVYSRPGHGARRILISGIKGSRGPLEIMPGLLLNDQNGHPTPAAQAISRQGRGLADCLA